ncbi:MAG: glucokinase [Myxococcales bacterium]
MLLAGDIGGTHTRLLLHDGHAPVRHETFDSLGFPSLEAALAEFLGADRPPLEVACFGVPGPVVGDRCITTNLPWRVDATQLARELRIPKVFLLNDLVALALGALTVPASQLRILQGGPPKKSGFNIATIAAGTGLGEALLVWDGTRLIPCGTEGGHTDFGPRDEVDAELLTYLRRRFGSHISYERVVSGPGLGNLYEFFRDEKALGETAENTVRLAQADDRNATIAELGDTGESVPARAAVDNFVRLYGAEAGNLALKTLATGGVYVAGAIAVALLGGRSRDAFVKAFGDKGRFAELLERIPIAVVLDTNLGLAGSVAYALRSLR